MKGNFSNVKKSKNGMFCSIEGEDGRTYFCHRNEFLDKKLWKDYCYNGNTCEFIVEEVSVPGKNPLAKHIVPALVKDPEAEKRRIYTEECRKRAEAKKIAKAKNIAAQAKLAEWKARKDEYTQEHLTYAILFRKREENAVWKVLSPMVMSKDLTEIKDKCKEYKEQYPKYMFSVKKVLWFEDLGIIRDYRHKEQGKPLNTGIIGI